jgi:putative flippase GtrA
VNTVVRDALGYGAVSAVSLGADMTILAILVHYFNWPNLTAAATSFLAGACIAYLLSVRFVFTKHRLRNRGAEFAGFVALGSVGLAVNAAVIHVAADQLGLDVLVAKGMAAGFSFCCNFVVRRQILFVQPPPI